MKPAKNLFNGFRNKKEFKNLKGKMEIIEATINQEPRKVILKKYGQNNNGFPPDFGGNGAFF